MKSLCAMAFVPFDEIVNKFELLCGQFPDGDYCTEPLSYFDETYIRGVQIHGRRTRPRFRPELYQTNITLVCEPKTTNATADFHHALKAKFFCYHLGVWKLFEGIKRDIGI
jgi:hypothetical protein